MIKYVCFVVLCMKLLTKCRRFLYLCIIWQKYTLSLWGYYLMQTNENNDKRNIMIMNRNNLKKI